MRPPSASCGTSVTFCSDEQPVVGLRNQQDEMIIFDDVGEDASIVGLLRPRARNGSLDPCRLWHASVLK